MSSSDDSDEIATRFDALTHIRHFETVFHNFYNLNIYDWVVFLIADNCATNQKPLIGCSSRKLNLQVQVMLKEDIVMKTMLREINEAMTACKNGLK